MYYIVTFFSVSDALYFEKKLTLKNIACKVIPVPRELSSSCGYAVESISDSSSILCDIALENEIEIEDIYLISVNNNKMTYAICK